MILILTQCFPTRLGGIESLISNLAIGLSTKEKVVVFADQHDFLRDSIYDANQKSQLIIKRTAGIKFFRRRKKFNALKKFLEKNQINLIIGDSWKSFEFCIDFLLLKKIPTICLAHGNELLHSNKKKYQRISSTIKKTSLIIANSNYTKKLINNLNMPEVKTERIYPGALDLRKIVSIKVHDTDGEKIILTLARIEKRKGHFFVIKAVKKLLTIYPKLKYIIAGDGPEKKYLEKVVFDENLSENIKFIGNINDGEKKYLFSKTDIMVMPTLDQTENKSIEGFGISYIEAAFFKIPSIANNIGGTAEAVLHNETGLVINNIDLLYKSLLDLLQDNKKREKLGSGAQERAINNFQWDKIIESHLKVYKQVLNH